MRTIERFEGKELSLKRNKENMQPETLNLEPSSALNFQISTQNFQPLSVSLTRNQKRAMSKKGNKEQ